MPISTLDPKVALVVIDLQKGLMSLETVHPLGDVVARSASLATTFRRHGLPVVLVNVAGRAPGRTEVARPAFNPPADWLEIVNELGAQPGDIRITKMRPGAFYETPLDAELRKRGVTQIVLTGVATSNGVEATARFAYEYGYNVVFVTDAMTDADAAAHEHSVKRIFPKIGETCTMEELLELLSLRGVA